MEAPHSCLCLPPGNTWIKFISEGNYGKLVENRSKQNVSRRAQLACHLPLPPLSLLLAQAVSQATGP